MTDIDPKALALRVADFLEHAEPGEGVAIGAYNSPGVVLVPTPAEARALAAFLREAVSDGWQDIASAPKDGTRILAIENYQRQGEEGQIYPEDGAVVSWATSRHDAYGGWAGFGLFLESFEPTHWMPLPTPPARIEDAGEPSHDRR